MLYQGSLISLWSFYVEVKERRKLSNLFAIKIRLVEGLDVIHVVTHDRYNMDRGNRNSMSMQVLHIMGKIQWSGTFKQSKLGTRTLLSISHFWIKALEEKNIPSLPYIFLYALSCSSRHCSMTVTTTSRPALLHSYQ